MTARVDPLLADLIKRVGAYLRITYYDGQWEIEWTRRPHGRSDVSLVSAPELNDAINLAIEREDERDRVEARQP